MIQDWLTCPVCDPADTDIGVALSHEHLKFTCHYCGSVVREFHADHERFSDP